MDFYGLFFALLFFLLVWCGYCVQSQRKKLKVVSHVTGMNECEKQYSFRAWLLIITEWHLSEYWINVLGQRLQNDWLPVWFPSQGGQHSRGKVRNAQAKTEWMSTRKDAQKVLPLVAWFLLRNILHICSCQVETNWLKKDRFLFDPVGNTLFKRHKLCKHFLHQESEQMILYLWMIQHQQLFSSH